MNYGKQPTLPTGVYEMKPLRPMLILQDVVEEAESYFKADAGDSEIIEAIQYSTATVHLILCMKRNPTNEKIGEFLENAKRHLPVQIALQVVRVPYEHARALDAVSRLGNKLELVRLAFALRDG